MFTISDFQIVVSSRWLSGLDYYSEYRFELDLCCCWSIFFCIQRHQIKILVFWNFNMTHSLVVGCGNVTCCYLQLLQCQLTTGIVCLGEIMSSSCSVSTSSLFLLYETPLAFHCNQRVTSLDKKD